MTLPEALPAHLATALQKKGYDTLTPVQLRVLEADAEGRDLRITSQTGSGKTIAIGLTLHPHVAPGADLGTRALVITPTRELAKQVQDELAWLYADQGVRVASVSGGASYRDEHRALATLPRIVVGTPGRLLDHLTRGTLDPAGVAVVVLDEADRMLDMGFRDELLAILGKLPETRKSHLVSATFPREVEFLARKIQADPIHVEGTKLGAANADIEHAIFLIEPGQVVDAVVNIVLSYPKDSRALIFAATRIEVAELSADLQAAGLAALPISGELEQKERTRALNAFKSGRANVLVATDVAARGIDVQDIAIVLQIDAPNDADTYTHRSGRTGRAGKTGLSAIIVPPRRLAAARRILDRARVSASQKPVPTKAALEESRDRALFEHLTRESSEAEPPSPRIIDLAAKLAGAQNLERTIARLLELSAAAGGPEPRDIRVPSAPLARAMDPGELRPRDRRREQSRVETPFIPRANRTHDDAPFRVFRVTWGALHGADPRRLLAMICRRGGVESRDIGHIDVGRVASTIEVHGGVAEHFKAHATTPDPRDPKVTIEEVAATGERAGRGRRAERGPKPGFGDSYESAAPAPQQSERFQPSERFQQSERPFDRAPAPRARPSEGGAFRERTQEAFRGPAEGGAAPHSPREFPGAAEGPRPARSWGDRPGKPAFDRGSDRIQPGAERPRKVTDPFVRTPASKGPPEPRPRGAWDRKEPASDARPPKKGPARPGGAASSSPKKGAWSPAGASKSPGGAKKGAPWKGPPKKKAP